MPRGVMTEARHKGHGTRAPRANRHWTDDELMSRCLTSWHGWERRRERYESIAQSLVGGLVVAGLVVGGLLL